MLTAVFSLLLGLFAGILGGLVGIGGGIIIVPALVYLFRMSQHEAQGTTLALMVPPIGLLAAWMYYKKGYVNLTIATFVASGFFVGGLLGARIANSISDVMLRKVFGVALLLIAIYTIFKK